MIRLLLYLRGPQMNVPQYGLGATDEIACNLSDLTVPHLVVDSMEYLPVIVPVLNLLTRSIPNVQTRILENEFFERVFKFIGISRGRHDIFELLAGAEIALERGGANLGDDTGEAPAVKSSVR